MSDNLYIFFIFLFGFAVGTGLVLAVWLVVDWLEEVAND